MYGTDEPTSSFEFCSSREKQSHLPVPTPCLYFWCTSYPSRKSTIRRRRKRMHRVQSDFFSNVNYPFTYWFPAALRLSWRVPRFQFTSSPCARLNRSFIWTGKLKTRFKFSRKIETLCSSFLCVKCDWHRTQCKYTRRGFRVNKNT
jgi:hypothetical protein